MKIPFYRVKRGKGFFQPTPAMRAAGFAARPLGDDGPAAWARALALNEGWQRWRRGEILAAPKRRLIGSVGEAWDRYLLTEAWGEKAPGTQREWLYAWSWIEPALGEVDPNTIELEDMEALRKSVREAVSEHGAHKVIKVWRRFWRVMASMRYCGREADPSKGLTNKQPKGRSAIWAEGEIAIRAKRAWRMGFHGLAAVIAVTWDTQFSPGDVRTLRANQLCRDRGGAFFSTQRAKTERDAIGTITRRTERVIEAYRRAIGLDILDDTPLFRDRLGKPYTMFSLADDFREIRGEEETRRLMDIRRSGAIEASAGDVPPTALAGKMANSIDQSSKLQETYLPRRVEVVRIADAARSRGRRVLRKD